MLKTSHVAFLIAVSAACVASCKDDKAAPAATPPATTTTAAAATTAAEAPKAAAGAKAKPDKAHKKSLPAEKTRPVPADWTELSDDVRGFSFSVPSGSKGDAQDKGGVGVFVAVLPKPHDNVLTMVVAYKDAKKSLDDLEKDAVTLITKVFDETGVKETGKKDLTDDYRVIDFTSEDEKTKVKSHWKALLATDVTDNYVMVVGTPEAEFKKNEPTIDELWGSFDMWSGGSNGDSH